MRVAFLALGLSISALGVAPPSFAQVADSCGGGCPKLPSNTREVSQSGVTLAAFPGNTLSAALAKGKKKRILIADAIFADGSEYGNLVSRAYVLGISVNGLTMNPQPGNNTGRHMAVDCGAYSSDPPRWCEAVGHWWLDMDDPASAALLGVPITVSLIGGDYLGGPAVGNTDVDISLRVRLEKK